MITWGFPIWIYLWLAGMSAGAYFTAFLAERFGKHTDNRLLHISLYMGIPIAITGVSFLLIDLSQPLRFWHLFFSFNVVSPMSIGSWLLVLWMGISMLILITWHLRNRIPFKQTVLKRLMNYLRWACFFASILLMTYTGVLLSASSRPLWASTTLLPPLFVISAISTGAAILIFVSIVMRLWKTYGDTIMRMVQVDAVVIGIEFIVLMSYFLWLSQSGVPGASESMRQIITGELAVLFWFGVFLLAILLPFILYIINWGKKMGEHRIVIISSLASSLCVIAGGLLLRTVIVIGGQL